MSATITITIAAAHMYQPFEDRAKIFPLVIYRASRGIASGAPIGGCEAPHPANIAKAMLTAMILMCCASPSFEPKLPLLATTAWAERPTKAPPLYNRVALMVKRGGATL